ncbi:MAG: DUF447 family protein [Nitrososphaera sp.]|nr:DUF447 family protein [Nitrososphaera sp.]
MITETIISTLDEKGRVNFAPMGIVIKEDILIIRPYKETTTYRNLLTTRQGVVHITDNVWIFAQSAISSPQFESFPAEYVRGFVLKDTCYYYEFTVSDMDCSSERAKFNACIVKRGWVRDFIGFNRAKNAVIEAAILATRIKFIGVEKILEKFEEHAVIVKKTGGPQEEQAMQYLIDYVTRSS